MSTEYDSGDEKRAQVTSSSPSSPTPSTIRSIVIIATSTMAMIVNTSNSTSASIALPTIGRELGIPENQLQWIVSAYSLTSGCLLLFFGRLADLHGRKKAFIIGMIWLAAFTLGCAFTNDALTLDILRAFQGVGAAAIIPASIGILAHSFPPSRIRSIAFATFAAGAPVGAAFGMAIGGALTQLTVKTWRSTFYLSTGLTVLCLLLGLVAIDRDQPSSEQDKRVDWLGALLVTAGLVLIVFVLGQGEIAPHAWSTPYIIVLLILGVCMVVLFVFWQNYLEKVQASDTKSRGPYAFLTPPPLMKVSLWYRANGRFAAIMAIAFLTWCCFLGSNFWIQLYYQEYLRLTPVLTMVRMLPMFITGVLCNIAVALVVNRLSVIYLLGGGTILTAAGAVLFAVIIPSSPYWAFGFPAAIISVFGADFTFSAGSLFVARVALPHEQSVAGALFTTMTQLGTAVGVTVTTVVFDKIVQRETRRAPIPPPPLPSVPAANQVVDLLPAYQAAQWTAFAFGILAAVTALAFFRGFGIVGHRKEDEDDRTVTSSGKHPEA
ncbi:Major facilitator superfamily (MFS) profile domain-containing protein [Pleurotus pulmonarius]